MLAGAEGAPHRIVLTVPRTFAGSRLPLAVTISQKDFPDRLEEIALSGTVRQPAISLAPAGAVGVTQGERRQLSLELENRGRLDALDVKVEARTTWPGLDLRGVPLPIGLLARGSAVPLPVEVYARPGAEAGTATLEVTITQADFPPFTERLEIPVLPQAPVRISAPPALPPVSGGPLAAPAKPAIFFRSHQSGQTVADEAITLELEIQDDRGLASVSLLQNGRPLTLDGETVAATGVTGRRWAVPVRLEPGLNRFQVSAINRTGGRTDQVLSLTRAAESRMWAAVIGVSRYADPAVVDLAYADADAAAFRDHLRTSLGIPESNLFVLENERATREAILNTLGSQLRERATEHDTVIVFFAGHGATEAVTGAPDGDGLVKYLLPHDAKAADLFSTAIDMTGVPGLLGRLRAKRVVLVLDACFSGAAGGRSLGGRWRTVPNEQVFQRIAASGRGRVVLAASDGDELATEPVALGHGVFTYFLLEGLRGAADLPPYGNDDGLINVDEAHLYTSRRVREATSQVRAR